MREEENIQLLFLLGEEVGGGHLLLYEGVGGDGGEQLFCSILWGKIMVVDSFFN